MPLFTDAMNTATSSGHLHFRMIFPRPIIMAELKIAVTKAVASQYMIFAMPILRQWGVLLMHYDDYLLAFINHRPEAVSLRSIIWV